MTLVINESDNFVFLRQIKLNEEKCIAVRDSVALFHVPCFLKCKTRSYILFKPKNRVRSYFRGRS